MSFLIDLQDEEDAYPFQFKQTLKSIFKSNLFICKNMVDNGKCINFFLKATESTFRFPTIWTFHLGKEKLCVEIVFYNHQETDLLRAFSTRMKIEASILIRMINSQILSLGFFTINLQSGLLKMNNNLGTLKMHHKKQDLIQSINRIFLVLKRYQELFFFIQPQFNMRQQKEKKRSAETQFKLSKLRALLNNTKNNRLTMQGFFWDLMRVKADNRQFTYYHVHQIGKLYMDKVVEFQNRLEDLDEYDIDQELFHKQLEQKSRHEKAKPPSLKNEQKDLDKIVYGLSSIRQCVNEIEPNPQDIPQRGAHSQIHLKRFEYYVSDTIHSKTVSFLNQDDLPKGKRKQGQLVYKVCNLGAQTSVNSFLNQLSFLRYVRDMSTPFIAKYYLQIKQEWTERDIIYMNKYQQNVQDLLKNRVSLSYKSRLQLSYKISKGLCFLYSRQVLHRDLKPSNIVVDSFLTPKLIDFGSVCSHFKDNYAEPKFKPKEARILTTQGYNITYKTFSSQKKQQSALFNYMTFDQHPLFDVFSFGKILKQIFFGNIEKEIVIEQNRECPLSQLLDNLNFLIQKCCSYNPDDRPCFGQITSFLGALNQLITNQAQFIQGSDEEDKQKTKQSKERSSKIRNKQKTGKQKLK